MKNITINIYNNNNFKILTIFYLLSKKTLFQVIKDNLCLNKINHI